MLLATGVAAAGTELAARGTAPLRARVAIGLAPVGFVLMTYAIWSFAWEEESETPGQLGWTGMIALLSALIATSAALLATAPSVRRLAAATGAFAAVAGLLSALAIWQDNPGDGIGKIIATAWILTALGFLLVPIMQRWAGTSETGERLLASHGGVELVAVRGLPPHPGDVAVTGSLERGERLVLRTGPRHDSERRTSSTPRRAVETVGEPPFRL